MLAEVTEPGLDSRAHVVVRDPQGDIRAWGSVHDRAAGRMVYGHVVDPALDDAVADSCSDVLLAWAVGQAHEVGTARGVASSRSTPGRSPATRGSIAGSPRAGSTRSGPGGR